MVDTSEAQDAVFILFSLPTSISRQKEYLRRPLRAWLLYEIAGDTRIGA